MRYCSSGAIVEGDDLLSCACIISGPMKAAANAKLRQPTVVIRFRLIASSRENMLSTLESPACFDDSKASILRRGGANRRNSVLNTWNLPRWSCHLITTTLESILTRD